MYSCSVCGKSVSLDGDTIIRECEHSNSAVNADLIATVYGESSMNQDCLSPCQEAENEIEMLHHSCIRSFCDM